MLLYDLIDPADPAAVRREVLHLAGTHGPGFAPELFSECFADVERLFSGEYPGYRASNTRYHDFEHTCAVLLAAARLAEGCRLASLPVDGHVYASAVFAALYHDVGLIQRIDETEGTGARHTVGHEERSIAFARAHLETLGAPPDLVRDVSSAVACTILDLPVGEVVFADERARLAGRILGSADLLGQLADRNYLEKLLLLFREFEEARIPGFDSELDLLQKTKTFYTKVAAQRLDNDLGGVRIHLGRYFEHHHGIQGDLYDQAVRRNIGYVDSLVGRCGDDFACYLSGLKRAGIVRQLDLAAAAS